MTLVGLALLLLGCSSDDEPGAGIIGYVEGFLGGVAADEPRAALVGRDVLSAGGSAADAAVAVYFAMSVTFPSSAGLGGGGVCVVHDHESGRTEALDFLARAPVTGVEGGDRPSAVPGAVRGFFALHSKYGRLQWPQLVVPAENLARFGTQVSRAFARQMSPVESALKVDPEALRVFGTEDGKRLVREGDFLRQFDLAAVLARLRSRGPGDFYTGQFARTYVDAVRQAGGTLDLESLRRFAPAWRETITLRRGNETIHFAPAPAVGGVLAAQFWAMLDRRYADAPREERNHLLAEVAMRGFADRSQWLRDDGSIDGNPTDLVAEGRIDQLMRSYRPDKHVEPTAAGLAPRARAENPSAATFVTVDRDGSAVACVVTLNSLFGIGRVALGTGIVPVARPGAGGRGATAFGPMLVINENVNEFYFAATASGGVAAPTALVNVAARVLLDETPLEDAVASVRVHHGGDPNVVVHEQGLSAPLVQSLRWRGHRTAATPALGIVNAVSCPDGIPPNPESCAVAVDPRGFGLAASAD